METLTYEIDKEYQVSTIVIENIPKSLIEKIKVTTTMYKTDEARKAHQERYARQNN
jgi:hypothetical protein